MSEGPTRLPEVGETFAGHRLLRRVGEGGMGVVFEAQNGQPEPVAMKILKPERAADPRHLREFIDEARATRSVEHENVVTIERAGEDGGLYYLLMEFVDGPELAEVLRDGRRVAVKSAIRIAIQVAKALSCAHAKGLLHRDVKPDNILLYRDGRARLTDFGIVKDISTLRGYLVKGRRVGTATYASPEQCLGKRLSHATDIYSLGATLYAMVCGRPPFRASNTSEVMKMHVKARQRPACEVVPEVPKALSKLIDRMMAKRQSDRPESMDRVIADLEMILAGKVPIAASPRPRRRAR